MKIVETIVFVIVGVYGLIGLIFLGSFALLYVVEFIIKLIDGVKKWFCF